MVGGYETFGFSARGVNHQKLNTVCQDYALHYRDDRVAVAAVADGHGSPAHFRSDRGARFACESAVKWIRKFVESESAVFGKADTIAQGDFLKKVEQNIIAEWRKMVSTDWNVDLPKSESIPPNFFKDLSSDNFLCVVEDIVPAYGTTLIASAVCDDFWFGIQIGDGKCVALRHDGSVLQPIARDRNCYANVTTSICDEDALGHFRHFWSVEFPAAIFLGTDGVDNSYPVYENKKHLANLYRTIADNFAEEGFKNGEKQLEEFLPVLTEKGSGDDVSIAGIIYTGGK
jgi:serine/threonine protein phosphatase PrpC